MAVTLRYFTEFGKPALQKTMCGGIYARDLYCVGGTLSLTQSIYCIFSECTMSSQRKFTFAISSPDEFLVSIRYSEFHCSSQTLQSQAWRFDLQGKHTENSGLVPDCNRLYHVNRCIMLYVRNMPANRPTWPISTLTHCFNACIISIQAKISIISGNNEEIAAIAAIMSLMEGQNTLVFSEREREFTFANVHVRYM